MPAQWLRLLQPELLERFFARLETANEQFGGDARGAAVNALEAAVEFVSAHSPGNEHLERPLRQLLVRMRNIDPSRIAPGDVLPPDGGESGGTNRRGREQEVHACAAYAVEFLSGPAIGKKVGEAAAAVAGLLDRAGFRYALKRKPSERPRAILAWRRDYRLGDGGRSGERYREYCVAPPLPGVVDKDKLEVATYLWLDDQLRKFGYSPPGVEWLPTAQEFLK